MNPFKGVSGRRCKRKAKSAVVEVKQEIGIKEEPNDGDDVIDVPWSRIDGEYRVNYERTIDFDDDFDELKNEIKSEEEAKEEANKKESAPFDQSNENDVGNEPMVNAIGILSQLVGSMKKRNEISERLNKRTLPGNQVAKKQKQNKHKCHVCNHLASRKYNLKVHLRTHTGERPFKCDVCSNSFALKHHLNRHKKTHGGFRCSKCNQGFEQGSARIDHERLCSPRKFECDICGLKTMKKENLTTHMRIHSGAKQFECPICFKSFTINTNLQRHSMTHINELLYACLKCGRRFATPKDKQTHEIRCQRQSIKCEICNKKFVQQIKLNQHLYTTHNDKFPFQCSKCFGGYATEDAKNAHEESCGHRQYQCHLCKEHRRDIQKMKYHMRKHHTGNRIRLCVQQASPVKIMSTVT